MKSDILVFPFHSGAAATPAHALCHVPPTSPRTRFVYQEEMIMHRRYRHQQALIRASGWSSPVDDEP